MAQFAFKQVDVFPHGALKGNPLAAVIDADGLTDQQMQDFARWTNLSETIFLQTPDDPQADYKVRIFTPAGELPFAGHPTLGACHIWLTQQNMKEKQQITQQCGVGLVQLRRDQDRYYFRAPPLRNANPLSAQEQALILASFGLAPTDIRAWRWVDNGPGWMGVLLHSREKLAAIKVDYGVLQDAFVGLCAIGPDSNALEVRAFCGDIKAEDPVTGSLNASLAQWLIPEGAMPDSYIARQGFAVGSDGELRIVSDAGGIWVGGTVQDIISGQITFPD